MDNQATSQTSPDTAILRKAGLTESQAKGYLALIQHGALSPVALAEKTGESRTNGYMICEKLETLGLATKKDVKKALYSPAHPSALETLAEKRRKAIQRAETEVKQGIDPLISMFYAATEMPGARTLQGVDGIKAVYADTLKTSGPIYLIRSIHDDNLMGVKFYEDYRKERAKQQIVTYALTPQSLESELNTPHDKENLIHRTILPAASYDAPVEVDIYGSKVALIAFGETQFATIIDSPPIAEAFRQLFQIIAAAHRSI